MPDAVPVSQENQHVPIITNTVTIEYQDLVEDPMLEQPPTPPWSPRYSALTACRRSFRRHALHGDPDA